VSEFVPNKRQAAILKMLSEDGFVATDDMVSKFEVTPQTIRRDLNELNKFGLITRFHGGAGQAKDMGNRPYLDRVNTRVEAKQAIADMVQGLIPDGATLFMSSGTTIEAIARALTDHKSLKIVTNNVNVAQIMSQNETFEVMIAGGQVRSVDGGIVGLSSLEFMEQFHMDYGLVGTNSVDESGALWDFDQLEVRIARATIKNSHKVILVADYQKFGRRAMNRMGHVSEFDYLVTDKPLKAPFDKLFADSGVETVSP